MNQYFRDDPIVAVSTSTQSQAAIGIIRITGFKDLSFLKPLCGLSEVKPRYAHYVSIKDSESVLDDGVLLFFKAPHSFTGENVIEFQVHGNPFNLERIISLLISQYGFKKAFPGEFTYRALRNKKMNLTQVEGLDLLLNASSSFGLSQATKIMNNELFEEYTALRDSYISLRSSIELAIDFSEDVGEEEISKLITSQTHHIDKIINNLFKRSQGDINSLLSPKIGLYGETNAGKSTLFNQIVGQDRAIVSDIHGTTRDFVSEYIYIDSQAYQLIDTAGLRDSSDTIEQEGISRGKRLIEQCFLRFYLINIKTWKGELRSITPSAYILTHVDLLNDTELLSLKSRLSSLEQPIFISGPMGAVSKIGPIEPLYNKNGPMGAGDSFGPMGPDTSFKFGPMGPLLFSPGPMGAEFYNELGPMGADSLKSTGPMGPVLSLNTLISNTYRSKSSLNPIPISRHRDVITDIYNRFTHIKQYIFNNQDIAIISHEINTLGIYIDELVGITSPDDVLDNIFSNFCIGK